MHEETSLYLLLEAQDQRLGAEQGQLPCGCTGASFGNCQETGTFIVRACHAARQPLQNHPSGHFGGWATPWSTEEMLDGQHQRVDIPTHARTAHKRLLQKRLKEDLLLNLPSCFPDDPIGQGTELNSICLIYRKKTNHSGSTSFRFSPVNEQIGNQISGVFFRVKMRSRLITLITLYVLHHCIWCPLLSGVSPPAHLDEVGMLRFMFFDINQTSLPTPFYSALGVCFCLYGPSINSPDNSPLFHAVLPVLFLSC